MLLGGRVQGLETVCLHTCMRAQIHTSTLHMLMHAHTQASAHNAHMHARASAHGHAHTCAHTASPIFQRRVRR